MSLLSRRCVLASVLLAGLMPAQTFAQAKLTKARIDWATYNPVSQLLKEKSLLEKEFAKDGFKVLWVRTVSSSNELQSAPGPNPALASFVGNH